MTNRAPIRNEPAYRAAIELRRSNAATPIPSGKTYQRHFKHRGNHHDRSEREI